LSASFFTTGHILNYCPDFGVHYSTFAVKERAERTGRNPQTGQEITIAAAKVPSFKPGKGLKDAVNG